MKIFQKFSRKLNENIKPKAFMLEQKYFHPRKSIPTLVFICQVPQIWISLESVYQAAINNPSIKTYLIAMPDVKADPNGSILEITDNGSYSFCEKITKEMIPAYDFSQKHWFDLKSLHPDYVFIQRPYDIYLPPAYRSSSICRYSYVCYVPYGYLMEGGDVLDCSYHVNFFKYVSMIFAENDVAKNHLKQCLRRSYKMNLHNIYTVGFPRFDLIHSYGNSETSIWKSPQDCFRVIWTPRWTTNKAMGGTNFFKYKDLLPAYFKESPDDTEFIFRPHPLAFKHIRENHLLTENEFFHYIQMYDDAPNMEIDQSQEYLSTFYASDVLISDMSSVIVDYIFTQKPIIFCPAYEVFNEYASRFKEAFYIVNSWGEMKQTLDNLRAGIDPLAPKRRELVHFLKKDCKGNAGQSIINTILAHYKGR